MLYAKLSYSSEEGIAEKNDAAYKVSEILSIAKIFEKIIRYPLNQTTTGMRNTGACNSTRSHKRPSTNNYLLKCCNPRKKSNADPVQFPLLY
jgi:hypothetical protein